MKILKKQPLLLLQKSIGKKMDPIKNKIIDSIIYARNNFQFTLINQSWGSKSGRCACPLGCVLLVHHRAPLYNSDRNVETVAALLQVSETWVRNFIFGFDNDDPDTCLPGNDNDTEGAFSLGQELFQELNPMSHKDYMASLDPMGEPTVPVVDAIAAVLQDEPLT
jgi:hypothetical protein